MEREDITVELVRELIAEQFPQWRDLPVVAAQPNGSDNRTFRLGEHLAARLPSGASYAAQVAKEHEWLPRLAPSLPHRIPEPVAQGRPSEAYPWPWSVYSWRPGEVPTTENLGDRRALAEDLSAFLCALYRIEPAGGPEPGAHNFFRGGSLEVYDDQTRAAAAALDGLVDARAALRLWEDALGTVWERAPVWVHGDMAPTNLLVRDGRLSAVIDFGCSAVGDPACDTVIAWTFFSGDEREAFRDGLGLDEGTWARGRAWAMWKALITLRYPSPEERGNPALAGARFGWRWGAPRVIDEVLTENARAGA